MNRLAHLILLLAAALLLLPPAAQAHKLSIFAWPEGGEIRGEVKFSGGRKAKNVQIAVQNAADHAVLAETACDENGAFRFTLPEQAQQARPDLLIVANGGEGHRGEWLLEAKDYAPAASVASVEPAAPVEPAQTGSASAAGLSEQQLRRVVAEEISKALSPVRQSIAESLDPEPTLRDILGGIGWLIGLAGLAAWAQSRRTKHS
jgi:nickel transport protein